MEEMLRLEGIEARRWLESRAKQGIIIISLMSPLRRLKTDREQFHLTVHKCLVKNL
jgi:hypothetical protein